ncbi:MAG: adenylyltransferase/cytidyltransferase family protein [Chloroflexi bacterium]|nr:adenylyltransferase/cytidyltransferase family protein [Chloroflexota bacterium]
MSKIIPCAQLSSIRSAVHDKKIVLCHGCFDLMHPGHIRHLRAAKNFGDVLIVTVTPDRFVNKGPGRPVFHETLRAESLASLEFVDYVAINRWPTAIETIKLLKPDFYVKGNDYSDSSEDITGNIVLEEQAVKEGGGEIRFTDEITFSSSNLINENFNVLSAEAKEYIEGFKKQYSYVDVLEVLKGLKDLNVLIVGDAILDEYTFCDPVGKVEKASIVSTKYLSSEVYAGGSLAAANHIAGFAGNVELVATLGKTNSMEDFVRQKLNRKIKSTFFYRKDAPTIIKRRYLDRFNVKLFEVAEINDQFIDRSLEKEITEHLDRKIQDADVVLVTDFGHGLITPDIQKKIVQKANFCAANAQTNSSNFGFNLITRYRDVDYISIDERELRLPYRAKYGELEPLIEKLAADTGCQKINVTLGESGSIYYQSGKAYFAPVFSDRVVDTVGAGDAVLSVTCMLACKDVDPRLIPFVGNAVGALKVKILGNKEPVRSVEFQKFIKYMLA